MARYTRTGPNQL